MSSLSEPTTSPRASALVIEDDRINRQALVKLLGMTGIAVDCAATLAEGFDKLRAQPTVVLLDLELPDGPGADILAHIRQERMTTRVCVLTGSIMPNLLDSVELAQPQNLCAEMKADAVFFKPYPFEELLGWVKEAMQQ